MKRLFIALTVFLTIGLCACKTGAPAPASTITPSSIRPLQVYSTATSTTTPQPSAAVNATFVPSPTPTPLTHVVKKGEDLGGIAYRYHLTLAALMAANPKVNANIMSVGTVLVIPQTESGANETTSTTLVPTAVALTISSPVCYTTLDKGCVCFALAHNSQSFFVESVSVTIRLTNLDTGEIISQSATTPLNLIPPGWALPVEVFFNAPVPQRFEVNAEPLTALPYTTSDSRYLNVQVENRQDTIEADGLSATLEGDLKLDGDANTRAGVTWAAAVAFDQQGNVVGVRRWEASSALSGDQASHFSLRVYSAGPAIDHLTLITEARR